MIEGSEFIKQNYLLEGPYKESIQGLLRIL